MAVTLDVEELAAIARPNFSINEIITAIPDDPVLDAIENVTATVDGDEPDLVITDGTESVSITGSYQDPWSDVFTYVDDGESDKTMTPIVLTGIPNVPENKKLYNLAQDMSDPYVKTFTVTVTYGGGQTQTLEVTQDINNEWEGIRSFMANYY